MNISDTDINRLAARVIDIIVPRLGLAAEPAPLVDKKAVADHFSVTAAQVDRWVKRGMPWTRVDSRKRFDLEACRKWHAAQGAERSPDGNGTPGLQPTPGVQRTGVRLLSRSKQKAV